MTNPRLEKTYVCNLGSEDIPEVTKKEIPDALKQLKNRKSLGEDSITSEMPQMGADLMQEILQVLFNKRKKHQRYVAGYFSRRAISENYRPISLLAHLYKLFTKIIPNRLTKKLDAYQLVEQAGFRNGFGTIDTLQAIRTMIAKLTEYNIKLQLAFVDYHKALESIESSAFLQAMDRARIDSQYSTLMINIYGNATSHVKITEELETVKILLNRLHNDGHPESHTGDQDKQTEV